MTRQCILTAFILFACLAWTQAPKPAITIPDRVVFRVATTSRANTKHAKPGDRLTMVVIAPETLDDSTVIPVGARLEGHIVESVPFTDSTREARLSIRMDKLKLKKEWVPINAFIVAQGQLKTTTVVGAMTSPCSDSTRRRSPADEQNCSSEVLTIGVAGQRQSSSVSRLLQDVALVEVGTPPRSSYLASRKGNIVIAENMAFLIRHVSQ